MSYVNYHGHILAQFILVGFAAIIVHKKCRTKNIGPKFTDETIRLSR